VQKWLVGATPFTWNFGSNWPRWSEIAADFRSLFARSDSAVTPSEKMKLLLSPLLSAFSSAERKASLVNWQDFTTWTWGYVRPIQAPLTGNAPTYLAAHRGRSHAPTPLDRHGDVCYSTATQHLWRSVCRNGWTTPVELSYDNVTVSESSNGRWGEDNPPPRQFDDNGALWRFS